MLEAYLIATTLSAAAIAAFAQYLFKKSVPRFRLDKYGILGLLANKGVWAGSLAYLASLAIYLKALGSGELSFVYPTFASTFVFVALISRFALKEKLGAKRIAGIALVLIGIAVVAFTYA